MLISFNKETKEKKKSYKVHKLLNKNNNSNI